MAKTCAICGKGKRTGHYRKLLRGHRNITGDRSFKPNLQKTTHNGEKVLACTKCIKSQSRATH